MDKRTRLLIERSNEQSKRISELNAKIDGLERQLRHVTRIARVNETANEIKRYKKAIERLRLRLAIAIVGPPPLGDPARSKQTTLQFTPRTEEKQ